MANTVFDGWMTEQQQRRDDIGELSVRLLTNPSFEQDFFFSNSLSQKVEWMFNQDYSRRDIITLIRAFEEWMAEQDMKGTAPEAS